ncbi:hypothetical protein F5Y15DRAFT_417191 [Xylariaceae sp. FL0016]|nr:hypothetical protein F5Y15DRAFT_417191 [Xylariaceae sp. FL0016]
MASTKVTEDDRPSSSDTAPGTALTDILPIPASKNEDANSVEDIPTLSHSLAVSGTDATDMAEKSHDTHVEGHDLGWNKEKEILASPLVPGIGNEDLWLLVRRFNKQIHHVKEAENEVPGNLDLNISDIEEFSPDKLRASVERFYMTVIIGVLSAIKHTARLRSWRESRRTSYFCTAYFIAWALDFVAPLIIFTLIILIVYPPSRKVLFPPAPIALVDSKSGGLQKPKAGVLGSHETATGAPENHKGEAQEQEASNFFNGFTSVVLTSATGSRSPADPESPENADASPGTSATENIPDPSSLAISAAEAKDVAAGGRPSPKHDKTKKPVENTIWKSMRPIMAGVNMSSDTYERLCNALSPTPPFPQHIYRLRLATIIVPLLLVSLFTTSYMFMKGMTFGIGFGFFGDPIISRSLKLLNRRFPHWQKILEVRNTVLKGVPTNAQLALTFLRIGERKDAPLPPPPSTNEPPSDQPAPLTDDDLLANGSDQPLDATDDELQAAIAHDPQSSSALSSDADASKDAKHKKRGSRLLGLVKGAAKGTVKSAITTDAVRAKVGSHQARNRLGAVPREKASLLSGPVDFKARYKGEKGRVLITTKSTTPAVSFCTESRAGKVDVDGVALVPRWSVAIGDIKELKKIGSYGFKAKMLVGWSLGREVSDSLEISDSMGTVRRVTALPLRDELFNRLIAIGEQKWEAW